MTPDDIKRLADIADRVRTIDDNIRVLGKNAPDRVQKLGMAIRNSLGAGRLGQFLDDDLGEVALCAIINALLHKREAAIADANGKIDFPPPPCPVQFPQENGQ